MGASGLDYETLKSVFQNVFKYDFEVFFFFLAWTFHYEKDL